MCALSPSNPIWLRAQGRDAHHPRFAQNRALGKVVSRFISH
jgi:hypothetical protein